jgi:hypothetical protein
MLLSILLQMMLELWLHLNIAVIPWNLDLMYQVQIQTAVAQ